MTVILVTGPSRSGKSEWAEQLAAHQAKTDGLAVVYVATAMVNGEDAEWCDRIQKHLQRRPAHWQTQEIPVELSSFISQAAQTDCLLIDSLGTWLANLIEQPEDCWALAQSALLQALTQTSATVILVAEETGWGVVPAYELGRRFRDRRGNLSRAGGEIADDVFLVTGGYALNLSVLGHLVSSHPGQSINQCSPSTAERG